MAVGYSPIGQIWSTSTGGAGGLGTAYTSGTRKGSSTSGTLGNYLATLQSAAEKSRIMNNLRYEQAMGIFDEIISRYGPEGTFMAGAYAELEKQKGRDVASEIAQSISSGMYGTTRPGTAGMRWEETVGAPARLKLEDIRMERLSQAQLGKAGFIERREDVYPDYGLISQLTAQAAARPTGGITTIMGETSPSYAEATTAAKRTTAPSAGGLYGVTTPTPGGVSPGGYTDPLTGQPMFTPTGVGMYLGGGRYLSPEQIEWKKEAGYETPTKTPTKTPTAPEQIPRAAEQSAIRAALAQATKQGLRGEARTRYMQQNWRQFLPSGYR